jgi:hypothetical protein
MSIVDDIENHVYSLIEEHRLDDNQAEELFVRFANALPTYSLTPKGQEIVDLVEQEDFKAGGGTD